MHLENRSLVHRIYCKSTNPAPRSSPTGSPSISGPARPSDGRHPPRPSTSSYTRLDTAVVQRPLEPKQHTSIRPWNPSDVDALWSQRNRHHDQERDWRGTPRPKKASVAPERPKRSGMSIPVASAVWRFLKAVSRACRIGVFRRQALCPLVSRLSSFRIVSRWIPVSCGRVVVARAHRETQVYDCSSDHVRLSADSRWTRDFESLLITRGLCWVRRRRSPSWIDVSLTPGEVSLERWKCRRW